MADDSDSDSDIVAHKELPETLLYEPPTEESAGQKEDVSAENSDHDDDDEVHAAKKAGGLGPDSKLAETVPYAGEDEVGVCVLCVRVSMCASWLRLFRVQCAGKYEVFVCVCLFVCVVSVYVW